MANTPSVKTNKWIATSFSHSRLIYYRTFEVANLDVVLWICNGGQTTEFYIKSQPTNETPDNKQMNTVFFGSWKFEMIALKTSDLIVCIRDPGKRKLEAYRIEIYRLRTLLLLTFRPSNHQQCYFLRLSCLHSTIELVVSRKHTSLTHTRTHTILLSTFIINIAMIAQRHNVHGSQTILYVFHACFQWTPGAFAFGSTQSIFKSHQGLKSASAHFIYGSK